jgi:hypothetical protein
MVFKLKYAEIFNMASWLIICVLFIFFSVLPLHATGTYYVGRDEGGVYFQTDDHGGWYIDGVDLKSFTIGQVKPEPITSALTDMELI